MAGLAKQKQKVDHVRHHKQGLCTPTAAQSYGKQRTSCSDAFGHTVHASDLWSGIGDGVIRLVF